MGTEDEFDPESATKEACLSLGNEASAWRDLFSHISQTCDTRLALREVDSGGRQ